MTTPTPRSLPVLLCSTLLLALGACAEMPLPSATSTPVAPAAPTAAANPTPVVASPPVAAAPAPRPGNRKVLTSGVIDTNALRLETTASGSRKTVFNGPTGTLQNFESHITIVNPGMSAHTPHTHPHEEMLILKEGTLEVTINGKTQIANPGAIIFYAPNDPHATKSVGTVPAVYYVFTWVTDQTQQPDVTTALPVP